MFVIVPYGITISVSVIKSTLGKTILTNHFPGIFYLSREGRVILLYGLFHLEVYRLPSP